MNERRPQARSRVRPAGMAVTWMPVSAMTCLALGMRWQPAMKGEGCRYPEAPAGRRPKPASRERAS